MAPPVAAALLAKAAKSRKPVLVAAAVILLLRSRLFTIPKDVVRSLRTVAYGPRLSKEELEKVLQQVYVDGPDGTKKLQVPYRDRLSEVRGYFSLLWTTSGLTMCCYR